MLLWLAGITAYTVVMVPVGTVLLAFLLYPPWSEEGPLGWLKTSAEMLADDQWWVYALIGCAIISVTQCLFLLPVFRLRPPQGTRPRSLFASFVLGALIAALLTTGLALGLLELVASLLHGNLDESPWGPNSEMLDVPWAFPGMLLMLVGSWVFWAMALLIFSRRLWPDTVLGRFVVVLFGGTILELLVVLPIDVLVRRRTDCYCATGTFFSLCLSAIGLLWLTGPGIVFAITARRRRLARLTHCARCGHTKGPSPGPVCPECGYEWLAASRHQGASVARATDGIRTRDPLDHNQVL